MSFGESAYSASLAYGKYEGYRNIIISIVIGLICTIIGLWLFISNPSFPITNISTNTPTNTPTTDNSNTPSTQNTVSTPSPAPLWLKSLFLVIGLLLLGGAYMYYRFINSKSYESVVATQGAIGIGTDVSRGIRNIFVSEGGYYYIN
jgi:hypothetical protein